MGIISCKSGCVWCILLQQLGGDGGQCSHTCTIGSWCLTAQMHTGVDCQLVRQGLTVGQSRQVACEAGGVMDVPQAAAPGPSSKEEMERLAQVEQAIVLSAEPRPVCVWSVGVSGDAGGVGVSGGARG